MYTEILSNIEKHIQLSHDEKDFFCTLLEYKKIKNRTFILREGEVCKHSVFVINGCFRGFTTDKNGFEHVLTFAPKNWWIGDMYSLISQKPGILNVQSMSDAEVLYLSKTHQELLYKQVPKFERFFRIIIENSLVSYQQRVIDNMSLSAEERYLKFCKIYPNLIHEISQKHVASFIGVTPEFLSKMKKGLK
jgi:CRP-like cAMP-binding protein